MIPLPTFFSTPYTITLGVVMVLAAAVFCFLAWSRSGFARGTGLLESLRLLAVLLIAFTLNQPEFLREYRPDERPTLVVLADVSRSMQTRDALDPDRPSAPASTRTEFIRPLLEEERWKALAEQLDVVFVTFSSSLAEPTAGTDLHAALTAAQKKYKNLRGIVLLSDGDWNVGEAPDKAAAQLKGDGVPVFVIAAGSDERLPDVDLTRFDVPERGAVGKSLRIPFVIANSLGREHEVTVSLKPSSGEAVTKQLTLGLGETQDSIVWQPPAEGEYALTMAIPPDADELIAENNERTVSITIDNKPYRVLLVEAVPRWEYRYLRNAMERDLTIEGSYLLFHPGLSKVGGGKGYIQSFPATKDELDAFDVVFLGDVGIGGGRAGDGGGGQLTVEQCRLIKGWVQSTAGGLVLMPGLRGAHLSLATTELEELYPVVLDAAQPRGWGSRVPAHFELTETGRRSLLTKLEDSENVNARVWQAMPGFQWHAPVLRAKAGSEVLATHKTESNRFGRVPLLVTKTFGRGKVLFMGTDAAWRWREGVEDKYHYRFWGQVIRWMSYQRNLAGNELMRLIYDDKPDVGDLVPLAANVASASGEPLQDGTVIVQVVAPSGQSESVRLNSNGEDVEWGLFTGSFTPQEPGKHQMTLTCRENGSTLDATIEVQGVVRERLGQPAKLNVLADVADKSGGEMVERGNLDKLLTRIQELPEPDPQVRRLRLWCHPAWAGFLVFLLGVFWAGRKMVGVI